MRTAGIALALAIASGSWLGARPGFAQNSDAPTPADEIKTPAACQVRLDARNTTFSFAPPVADGECAIPLAVRLQSLAIGGDRIAFRGEPTLDCRMAERLADWIGNVVEPLAESHLGSGLIAVETGPGYACRNRNNAATGKISEHAKGNALDIAAFVLRDGRRIAVRPAELPAPAAANFLAAVRATACGYFLTVLGPGGDAAHAEHLHLDLGPHGRTLNYRICQ